LLWAGSRLELNVDAVELLSAARDGGHPDDHSGNVTKRRGSAAITRVNVHVYDLAVRDRKGLPLAAAGGLLLAYVVLPFSVSQ